MAFWFHDDSLVMILILTLYTYVLYHMVALIFLMIIGSQKYKWKLKKDENREKHEKKRFGISI